MSFTEDDELPEKLREIVERKKEVILKRREKTGYLPEEARIDVPEVVVEKVEGSEDKKDEDSKEDAPTVQKKFKSGFDDVLD